MLFLLAILVGAAGGADLIPAAVETVLFGVAIGFAAAVLTMVLYMRRWVRIRLFGEGSPYLREQTLRISPGGLDTSTAQSSSHMTWSYIYDISQDANYIYLRTSPIWGTIVIPRRFLASPEDSHRFVELAASCKASADNDGA